LATPRTPLKWRQCGAIGPYKRIIRDRDGTDVRFHDKKKKLKNRFGFDRDGKNDNAYLHIPGPGLYEIHNHEHPRRQENQ